MRIDLRTPQRQRLFTVDVDPANPPTVVRPVGEPQGHAVHLNWDRAIDDEQHLRHCPACGCQDLYVRHEMPRVTAFVMIALAAVVAVVMLGHAQLTHALIVLGVVGLIDAGVYLFFSGKVLVCYRCRSEYRGMPIGGDAKGWETALDEQHKPAEDEAGGADKSHSAV